MHTCAHCHDRYPADTEHECYVLLKARTGERLAPPPVTDQARLGRAIRSDADWLADREVERS